VAGFAKYGSKNLEVTRTETTPTQFSLHCHCNSCQSDEDIRIEHELDKTLCDVENKFKNMLK